MQNKAHSAQAFPLRKKMNLSSFIQVLKKLNSCQYSFCIHTVLNSLPIREVKLAATELSGPMYTRHVQAGVQKRMLIITE